MGEADFAFVDEARFSYAFSSVSALLDTMPEGIAVVSPVVHSILGHDLVFSLYPCGRDGMSRGYASIALRWLRRPTQTVLVRWTLIAGPIQDLPLPPDLAAKSSFSDWSTGDEHGFPKFMAWQNLKEASSRLGDKLVVSAVVQIRAGEYTVPRGGVCFTSTPTLESDWSALLKSGVETDLTLQLVDGRRYAHKVVLMARSPVFSKMFESNMMENQTGTVDIQDVDLQTMDAFLNFLYCDSVPIGESGEIEIFMSLLPVASKYQVIGLEDRCRAKLVEGLDNSNAVAILQLASEFNNTGLKDAALDYITSGSERFLATLETQEFDELSKGLMKDLMAAFARGASWRRKKTGKTLPAGGYTN